MFQGFSQGSIDFLWGIRLNNERPWFLAHKQEYLELVDAPIKALAAQVFDAMHAAYPKLDLTLHVSRIYRDARRLFGRGPYKDHMWFSIERPHEAGEGVPALYFEIGPTAYGYGCGFWDAGPATMAKLRRRIETRPEEISKLARRIARSKFTLGGEAYKRPKGDVGKLLDPWYNRKSLHMGFEDNPDGVLFTPQLADEIIEGFRFLMPIYQYLDTVSGDPEAAD